MDFGPDVQRHGLTTSMVQRLVFYLGLMTMILALPLKLPPVFVLRQKVPR
jgi:hypothetical protein